MSLVTGEAVVLDVRTAALPSRMLAAMLDGLIQGAALLVLFLTMGLLAGSGSLSAFMAVTIVIVLVVGLGYPVLFETLMHGRTPGKAALGLRVVRDDAGPIGFRQAFVRGLIGLLIERPGITSGGAAVITSLIDPRGRRLGDMAAGTMVIQERVVAPNVMPVLMPEPLAGWAATADLSRVPDELALSIRSFLARSSSLTAEARNRLGAQLTGALDAVISPLPPPGTPGWAYLSAVLAERRRREELNRPAPVAPPGAYPEDPFHPAYQPAPLYGESPVSPPAPAPVGEPVPDVATAAAASGGRTAKTTARKAVAKAGAAKAGAVKKAPAPTPVKKAVTKQGVAKQAVAKKAVAKQAVAKQAVAKQAVAKQAVAKKQPAKKAPASKASSAVSTDDFRPPA